jgi:hypothetical protein
MAQSGMDVVQVARTSCTEGYSAFATVVDQHAARGGCPVISSLRSFFFAGHMPLRLNKANPH